MMTLVTSLMMTLVRPKIFSGMGGRVRARVWVPVACLHDFECSNFRSDYVATTKFGSDARSEVVYPEFEFRPDRVRNDRDTIEKRGREAAARPCTDRNSSRDDVRNAKLGGDVHVDVDAPPAEFEPDRTRDEPRSRFAPFERVELAIAPSCARSTLQADSRRETKTAIDGKPKALGA